jgi:hypothetical protein
LSATRCFASFFSSVAIFDFETAAPSDGIGDPVAPLVRYMGLCAI